MFQVHTQIKKLLASTFFMLFFWISLVAQTSGTLSFSVKTTAPTGVARPTEHVVAVWIESASGSFIKTKVHYGLEKNDDHLFNWTEKSNSNLVDAITGPTVENYTEPVTFTWNGTDTNDVVVPDGDYEIFVEMGWGVSVINEHCVDSFLFKKSTQEVHLTPEATPNYSNITIDWDPIITMIDRHPLDDNIYVFPNPTKDVINLNFMNCTEKTKIKILNTSNQIIFEEMNINGFLGKKSIDISDFKSGLYFLNVRTDNKSFVYKIIVNN